MSDNNIDDDLALGALTNLVEIADTQFKKDDDGKRVGAERSDQDALGYVYPVHLRMQALRAILDFTKSKPAQKNEVTISSPEAFLEAIAENEEAPDGRAPSQGTEEV